MGANGIPPRQFDTGLRDADALDDRLSKIFTPADDIAEDGHVHAEVALGTPVPWES